jgi:hypothetical protein
MLGDIFLLRVLMMIRAESHRGRWQSAGHLRASNGGRVSPYFLHELDLILDPHSARPRWPTSIIRSALRANWRGLDDRILVQSLTIIEAGIIGGG